MGYSEFLLVKRQLAAAAQRLSKLLELFRRYDQIGTGSHVVAKSNDELIAHTGHAAPTMAGRNQCTVSHALLKQAQSLLPAT
jgi:hypothetical protein